MYPYIRRERYIYKKNKYLYMIVDIIIPYMIYIYVYTYKANTKYKTNQTPPKINQVKFSKYNKRVCNHPYYYYYDHYYYCYYYG